MSEISAIAPVTASKASVFAQSAAQDQGAARAVAEPREDVAPIALAPNGISRVIMDARSDYSVGAASEKPEAAGRDFDRLAYVLEGFEHMRRVSELARAAQSDAGDMAQIAPAQDAGGNLNITL